MEWLTTALAVVFSTFVGAFGAYWTERISRRRDDQLREEAALDTMVFDLASRRALRPAAHDWSWAPGELDRVKASIFQARTLVQSTRASLRPKSDARPVLRQMHREFNAFLEAEERDGAHAAKTALRDLITNLSSLMCELRRVQPSLAEHAPGSNALPN